MAYKSHLELERVIKYINANEIFIRKISSREISPKIDLNDVNWIDGIRAKLGNAGYVDKMKPGVYKRIQMIPEDLTPQQLNLRAYGESMDKKAFLKMKKHCRPEWNGWYNGIIYDI